MASPEATHLRHASPESKQDGSLGLSYNPKYLLSLI